jgi:lycopene beta-cyclase
MHGHSEGDRYDFIIAGGGAAGLSLAHHLLQHPECVPNGLLILEPASKTVNDRTWCFWETDSGPFEHLVYHQWDSIGIYHPQWSRELSILPYRYKMIRSADFYAALREEIARHPLAEWRGAALEQTAEYHDHIEATTAEGTARGRWLVNTVPPDKSALQKGRYLLLQHFLGWVLESERPVFDPGRLVFMDFRIPQAGETRFCYVLPLSPHRALVEFTVFSASLLEKSEYQQELSQYIRHYYGPIDYQITHREFGVIPMTDAPFPARTGARTLNLGTRGGQTKPSTGYTFQRIQRRCRAVVDSLHQHGHPFDLPPAQARRFAFYDRVLFHALQTGRVHGSEFFTRLFRHNPPQLVLKFLDEDTDPGEESRIMMSAPWMPFLRSSWDVLQGAPAAEAKK